jgi:Asp-tRNA(Asn)/Glu-tRNA(Gln) amidotransferase A subunit family amidase
VTEDDAQVARDVVAEAGAHLRGLLGAAVLVLPTAAGGAPPLDAGDDVIEDERAATLRLTCLAGIAGAPAVSVPLLRTADGRPAGLCFVGGAGTDRALLRLADAAIASSTRP